MKKVAILTMLIVFILGFSGLYAQTNIGFNGVGAFVGLAMPEDPIDNTLAFGAKVDLGTIFMPELAFEAELAYWSKSYDEGQYYEWSYSQLYVSALVKYMFSSGSDLKPFAGGGLGFVHQTAKADYSGPSYGYDVSSSASETDLCIHLLGGVKYNLSDMLDGFAEARYSLGGADTFFILAGVIYKLNK